MADEARRCSPCGLNWPKELLRPKTWFAPGVATCPVCGGDTNLLADCKPMGDSEAKHLMFEAFWQKRQLRQDEAMRALEQELKSLPEVA